MQNDQNPEILIFKEPEYRCPKHGAIGNARFSLFANDKRLHGGKWNFEKHFCFYCFTELVEKHCFRVEQV